MKFFENNKFIFKLIASLCIFLVIINFGMSPKARAEDDPVSAVGGTLLDPIASLLGGLGDGVMQIIQKTIMGTDATVTYDNSGESWVEILVRLLVIVAIAAATIAIIVATTGLTVGVILGAIGKALSTLGITKLLGTIAVVVVADQVVTGGAMRVAATNLISTTLGNSIVFPLFTYGPEEIFSGKILLFDANIFEPKEVFVRTKAAEVTVPAEEWNNMDQSKFEFVRAYYEDPTVSTPEHVVGENALVTYKFKVQEGHTIPLSTWNQQVEVEDEEGNKKYEYIYRSGLEAEEYFYKDGEKEIPTSINNSAYELKNTISKWYYVIRNISIVGLMLVLLYVGIRMLLSTVASEKSKYKQMFADWVVAVCLIFLLHYIMVFGHYFTERITSILSNAPNSDLYTITISDPKPKLVEQIKEIYPEMVIKDENGNDVIQWPTNLMGVIRGKSQERNSGSLEYVGYTICYLVLVIFTFTFTFAYIKRLVMLLFLTVIAPFVAFTYPIDKLRDGKAQAFDFWLKEYVTNLLIQPFHLLLYTMFISMAFELSSTNIVYSLVVIGFMVPSEKILRKIFSLDKAESAGLLSGATGAAMAISAMNSLNKFANKKKEGKKEGQKTGDAKNDKINFMNRGADDNNTASSLMKGALNEKGDLLPEGEPPEGGTPPGGEPPEGGTPPGGEPPEGGTPPGGEPPEGRTPPGGELPEGGTPPGGEPLEGGTPPGGEPPEEETSGGEPPEEETTNGETEDQEILSRKEVIARYLAARALNFRRRNINTKTIAGIAKTGGRWASKLAFGALGAGIGLASGIATGKLDDVAKNTAAGAFAGSSIGQGLYNRGESVLSSAGERAQQYHESALRDVYGNEEYERRQKKKLDEEFRRNSEMRRLYAQQFDNPDKEELEKIMQSAIEYRKYGITDNDTIIKAMKLNPNNRIDKRSMSAAKLAPTAKSEKDLESAMKRFKKETGLSDSDARVKDMERRIRTINDML